MTKGRRPKTRKAGELGDNVVDIARPQSRHLVPNQKKTKPKNAPADFESKPKCPSWLSPGGKAVWTRLVPVLHAEGHIAIIDRELCAAYCEAAAEYKTACDDIRKRGVILKRTKSVLDEKTGDVTEVPVGGEYYNPYYGVRKNALKTMVDLGDRLGMGGLARGRITKIDTTATDALDSFLERGR